MKVTLEQTEKLLKTLDRIANTTKKATLINVVRQGEQLTQHIESALSNSKSFQKVWKAAKTPVNSMSEGIKNITSEIGKAKTGLQNLYSSQGILGDKLKAAVKKTDLKGALETTIGKGMELDDLRQWFQVRLGEENGQALFLNLQHQARDAGVSVEELAKSTADFMTVADTFEQLDALDDMAVNLSKFDLSGGGLQKAAAAMQSAMTGDSSALADLLNMDTTYLKSYNLDEIYKTQGLEAYISELQTLMELQGMNQKGSEALSAAPQKQWQKFLSNLQEGFSSMSMQAVNALAPLVIKLNEWFSSDSVQSFFQMISIALYGLANVFGFVIGLIIDNWEFIQTALMVTGALLLPGIITSLWGMVAPILANAAAFLVANYPVLLLILLLTGLITMFQYTGASFADICSSIGGLIGWIFGLGYNVIADIWNVLAVFVEFLANVFQDPLGSIVRLFVGVFDFILGIIETVAGAIGSLFGQDWSSGIANFRKDMNQTIADTFGEPEVKIARMEKKDISEAMKTGSDIGRGFGEGAEDFLGKIGGMTDGLGNPDAMGLSGNMFGTGNGFFGGDQTGNDPSGAKNDPYFVSDVNVGEEDMDMMRELAEMRYVQKINALSPSVVINAQIAETADTDAVLQTLERDVWQHSYISAEGSYA